MSSDADAQGHEGDRRHRPFGAFEQELTRFGALMNASLVGLTVRSGRSEVMLSTPGGTDLAAVDQVHRVLRDAAGATSAGFEVISSPLAGSEDRWSRLLVWFDAGAALAVEVGTDAERVADVSRYEGEARSLLGRAVAGRFVIESGLSGGSGVLARVGADGLVEAWPVPVPAGTRVLDLIEEADRTTVADAMWSVLNGATHAVRVSCRLAGEQRIRHWYLAADGAGGIEGVFVEPVRPKVVVPAEIARWLTWRERQVAGLIVSGYRPDEAAVELGVSINTLRNHLKLVFSKLGVHGQRELMSLVDHHGEVE